MTSAGEALEGTIDMAASPWDQAEEAPGTVRARVATALAGVEVEVAPVAARTLAGGQVQALMAEMGDGPFGLVPLPVGRKGGAWNHHADDKEVVLSVALQAMPAWVAVQ